MQISILKECGYEEAMLGLSLSYNTSVKRAKEVAETLAHKDGGHNKFLESIYVWLLISAPRFWWQEADTYRLSTKQSESTMHTLSKRALTQEDFEYEIDWRYLAALNEIRCKGDLVQLKNVLPEGFLQRRLWVINYKTIRNIITQRESHKLPQWKHFCRAVMSMVNHPELIK